MYKVYVVILVCLFALCGTNAHAQVVVNDGLSDSVYAYSPNIIIHTDPRLKLVVDKHKGSQRGGIYSGRGFRIQIYYGNDRAQAIQRKLDFMRRYPNIPTYMSYVQPQYRVKVGNFSSREDALDMYRQCISLYGACMIVPDVVVINTLNNQQDD
jgi:hypothetical protein